MILSLITIYEYQNTTQKTLTKLCDCPNTLQLGQNFPCLWVTIKKTTRWGHNSFWLLEQIAIVTTLCYYQFNRVNGLQQYHHPATSLWVFVVAIWCHQLSPHQNPSSLLYLFLLYKTWSSMLYFPVDWCLSGRGQMPGHPPPRRPLNLSMKVATSTTTLRQCPKHLFVNPSFEFRGHKLPQNLQFTFGKRLIWPNSNSRFEFLPQPEII